MTTNGAIDVTSTLVLKPESKELLRRVGKVADACARRADHF